MSDGRIVRKAGPLVLRASKDVQAMLDRAKVNSHTEEDRVRKYEYINGNFVHTGWLLKKRK